MPMVPVLKSFIVKSLPGGALIGVKYFAQIGNKRENLGKGMRLSHIAKIRSWLDQERGSYAQTLECGVLTT